MLKNGGNAVDAAIAVMVCDGAVCPEYMGIGGGFLLSVYNATTKKVTSVDARETAPAAADESMYLDDPKAAVHGTYDHRFPIWVWRNSKTYFFLSTVNPHSMEYSETTHFFHRDVTDIRLGTATL